MTIEPLPVPRWPACRDPGRDLLVVAVDTPDSAMRDVARRLVRAVLREILGPLEFVSRPGQAIRPVNRESPVGISVSHENECSLVAVNFSGPVGVDLLRLPDRPDWQAEIPALAETYLGPGDAREIAGRPSHERVACFARAWTRHEARLKCRGLGLEEWGAALEELLSPCRVRPLLLPAGYVGAVATLRVAEIPAL